MTAAQARGQRERPFTASQFRQYKRAQEIRDRHADGEPLAGRDLAFVLGLLKQHPRGRQKASSGIAAIVAGRYIGGSRCFFVIRADGTAVDLSVIRCLGEERPRSELVRAAMRRFDLAAVVRAYRRFAHPDSCGYPANSSVSHR